MPIDANFNKTDVEKRFDAFVAVIEKRQIKRLQYLGEECVKKAREVPPNIGFWDQTGNLRSSIGFMIFRNGTAIHGNYIQAEGVNQQGESLNGTEGINAGQMLAKRVGAKYKQGISLVVTAGMNYAVYLEANGRDVITSAESLARQELPKMLEELKKNINKVLSE